MQTTTTQPAAGAGPDLTAAAIGKRFRDARSSLDIPLKAVEAGTGITASHVCNIEGGRSNPSLILAARLAAFYGVSLDAIVSPKEAK